MLSPPRLLLLLPKQLLLLLACVADYVTWPITQ
jgi:hypothetical protein